MWKMKITRTLKYRYLKRTDRLLGISTAGIILALLIDLDIVWLAETKQSSETRTNHLFHPDCSVYSILIGV